MKRSAVIALTAVILTVILLGIAHLVWPTVQSKSIAGVVALASVVVSTVVVLIFWRRK